MCGGKQKRKAEQRPSPVGTESQGVVVGIYPYEMGQPVQNKVPCKFSRHAMFLAERQLLFV